MREAGNKGKSEPGSTHISELRMRARLAGAFYFFAVAIAVFCEFVAPGLLGVYAIVIPIGCSALVTVLLYTIFRHTNARVSWLALLFNLAGLAFEATQWQPHSVNLGMVLHGVYCILLGLLIGQSSLLPRIFGISMALAGIIWLLYLAPPLVHRMSGLNTMAGLLFETAPMLWFLTMGVRPRQEQPLLRASEVRP